jgi:hypothetical protein
VDNYARLVRFLLRECRDTRALTATNPLTAPLTECCRHDDYDVVEDVVVAVLLDSLERPGQPPRLPEDCPAPERLSPLVEAVRVAALHFLHHAVAEVLAPGLDLLWDGKPVFTDRRLYLAGRLIGKWRDQPAYSCPQLTVLTNFQGRGWPRSIPNPLDSEDQARDACKNLNRKVGGFLHFTPSFDLIFWSRVGNDT